MQTKTFRIGASSVAYHFDATFSSLASIVEKKNSVLVTDENVFGHHGKRFKGWNTIVLKPGEEFKVQATVDAVIDQLIEMGADRQTTLVGVGGGVVTDLTGYIASIYMRGVPCGFVPTTLLALVDASIGGKNGIDVGVYKNMAGTIRQPQFILHDMGFLATLPDAEWRSGFAEIIKHAAIRDAPMFRQLEASDLDLFKKKKKETAALVMRNALLKTKVVQADERETGDRKLLNFGHTLGHALENQYELSHGEAISIGMGFAAGLSAVLAGFRQAERLTALLESYGLPVAAEYDADKVLDVLQKDKKKQQDSIRFILLERLGKAVIQSIPINQLAKFL
ncbi:MAG: 3-dehydroquinate synthase [Flaviaesturariibacter sp.]|nr:3-dehydroquinate synthase [Flaviaesturariibacter sp.]